MPIGRETHQVVDVEETVRSGLRAVKQRRHKTPWFTIIITLTMVACYFVQVKMDANLKHFNQSINQFSSDCSPHRMVREGWRIFTSNVFHTGLDHFWYVAYIYKFADFAAIARNVLFSSQLFIGKILV